MSVRYGLQSVEHTTFYDELSEFVSDCVEFQTTINITYKVPSRVINNPDLWETDHIEAVLRDGVAYAIWKAGKPRGFKLRRVNVKRMKNMNGRHS